MSTITFSEWGFGLDLRQGASTSDANRLRVLKNAYITDGKRIRKRGGVTKIATLQPGTVGMFAGGGVLNTFQIPVPGYPLVTHPNPLLMNNELQDVLGVFGPDGLFKLAGVLALEMFNGIPYVVAQHWDNHVTLGPQKIPLHHYLNTTPATSHVVDAPRSTGVAKAASKLFSPLGDVVKFCATNNPRDWTTVDDAGFLPVGLQQSGNKDCVAVGNYQNRLVVFFPDSSQLLSLIHI